MAGVATQCIQFCFEDGSGWTDYLTAIGTVGAVFAAIGIAALTARRESRSRPKLSLHYDHQSPDDLVTGVIGTTGQPQHWLRARVANKPGRRSAQDVELLIVNVATPQAPGALRSLQGFPFHWANTKGETTRLTIAPGVERHIDIAALLKSGGPQAAIPLHLATAPQPADSSQRLTAGVYTLLVVLAARDTDATYYEIELIFDGRWHDSDEIRAHLQVAGPTKVKPPHSG